MNSIVVTVLEICEPFQQFEEPHVPYVGGIQSLAWPLRGGAWGASRVWLDTAIGRRDFKLRELLLRAVPPSPTVRSTLYR